MMRQYKKRIMKRFFPPLLAIKCEENTIAGAESMVRFDVKLY